MRYAFFLGCLIPAREPHYEVSMRKIAPKFGIDLVDIEGANCCAPFSIQSIDYFSWLALAARNLCLAEQMNLDILALCNDCYESLLMTNIKLKEDKETRSKVNEILRDLNLEFTGKINVKILSDVLYEDVGLEKIKDTIKAPFNGLRVAVQPGCHLTRPKRIHFSETTVTPSLDKLVEATGARSISYEKKGACCGGPLRGVNDVLALKVAKQKLDSIKNADIDCIVTVCPFCYLELDLGQLEIKRHLKEDYNIPVLHFVELLRLSMGMKLDEQELRYHRTPITKILDLMEAK